MSTVSDMEKIEFEHIPVMLSECMEALNIRDGKTYVDCTAGGGGHSAAIAERMGSGRLISLDRDDEAIAACRARVSAVSPNTAVVKCTFDEIASALDSVGVGNIDGVLWDLGVSSHQLDTPERGFSYMADAPLDMRMDTGAAFCAADVVNTYSEKELSRIISEYGEEKFAQRIAAAIAAAREKAPVRTTLELADIVKNAIPAAARRAEAQHPAKRTFQAIRIEVNGELAQIEPSIRAAVERLNPGGRAAVITFHSLEDRIVKRTFRDLESPCTCPPDFPVCVCGKKPVVKAISKKPITASAEELEKNPRARSAKLRVVEKL